LLVVCLACSVGAYALSRNPAVLSAIATAEATETPPATATPGVGVGDHMRLGTDYQKSGLGFTILNPQDHYAASDPFAAVIDLGRPFNTTTVKLMLVKVDSSGAETVVDSADQAISDPNYTELAYKIPSTGTLMGNNPPGIY
jgi:hypothetical protein